MPAGAGSAANKPALRSLERIEYDLHNATKIATERNAPALRSSSRSAGGEGSGRYQLRSGGADSARSPPAGTPKKSLESTLVDRWNHHKRAVG